MKKISFNDYIPEELADNESCRLITTEQYKEYLKLKEENKSLKKQLDKKEKDLMATVGTLVEIAKVMGWEK